MKSSYYIIYVSFIVTLAAISIIISGSCTTKAKSFEQLMKEFRSKQEMNEIVVDIEGHTCINKNGIFRVNKKFGLDELPIIYSWSCEYRPEKIHND